MFEPGDKVICVNDRDIDPMGVRIHGGRRPVKNELYCVEDCWSDDGQVFAVSLVGMPATPRALAEARFGWFAWRFRKVEELREARRAAQKVGKPELAPNQL